MKNLKRVACLVLALAVVCSLGLTALAASEDPYTSATADTRGTEFPDVTATNNDEAIYALKALGVFAGFPDGKFYPDNNMTRAEFAKIIFFFCGNKEIDATYFASMKSQFPDIAEGDWAEGYINFCATEGHFIGYPDGTFKAGNTVTMQEAATVLLRLLGYTDDLRGVWPNDYNRKAVDIGLTEYVNYIGGAPANRDQLAQMSYNILDCYKVTYIADSTAANIGYLAGGASAILGTLYNDFQGYLDLDDSLRTILGYINMYAIDNEGYAYLYGRTNEGMFVYYDLLADAFGASKWNVHFADLNYYANKERGEDMIESCGWYVDNKATGALGLDFYDIYDVYDGWVDGDNAPLASTYYLVGGDLTDLGDTDGRIIYNARGEIIFAATDGRAASVYSNLAGKADYYDAYSDQDFGIFVGATQDRLGYTTFSYISSDEPDDVQKVVGKTVAIAPDYRFYNMTTGKFIDYTELVPGDVGYVAGYVGNENGTDVELILIYNAAKGNLTEVANQIGINPGYAKIAGKSYTYNEGAEALLSVNGGASYDVMTYMAMSFWKTLTTMEVSYVPAYRSTQLAYVSANLMGAYTNPVGVVTGYTYGTDYVFDAGRYVATRSYTGVTILDEAGKTVTYEFAKAFTEAMFWDGTLGDLITLRIDKDGKVANADFMTFAWDFTYDGVGSYFVNYAPTMDLAATITTNEAAGRITITLPDDSSDIYTLASDAVIYMISTDIMGAFGTAQLISAADFLKTASYQLNQIDIYKSIGDNNTITGLYLVNAVAANQKHVGVAVGASIYDGKYILTMIDGTQFEVAQGPGYAPFDIELYLASVPSFVTFEINAEGKIFHVQWIMHQDMSTPTPFTDYDEDAFNFAFSGTPYTIVTGSYFESIYTNSVVTEDDQTLFLSSSTVYYDFTKNAPTAITEIISDDEADIINNPAISATEVTYVYNYLTHEVAYVFVTNYADNSGT